jgi:hypothetical protein
MHPIADGYRAVPSSFGSSELTEGDSAELVDLAISAWQEKKILSGHQLRVWILNIRKRVGVDDVRAGKPKVASGARKRAQRLPKESI